MNLHERRSARPANHHSARETRLPPKLRAAFARLGPATPVPPWPRSVRIGVDYSLRVTGMNPQTDAEADSLAYACFVLGNLAERDPPGDPPATCDAYDRAEEAGPAYGQAFALLNAIRDSSMTLAASGMAVRALPEKAMRLLQKAARAEPVPEAVLLAVLDAAQELAAQLGSLALRRFPGAA